MPEAAVAQMLIVPITNYAETDRAKNDPMSAQ